MPLQDSTNDTIYRFIEDPTFRHKETLSGRVSAACVSCRRKKIKCNGEVPCITCKEKGIVCEGLTRRKRRQSKSDSSKTSDATAGADQAQVTGSPPDVTRTGSSQPTSPSDYNRNDGILRRPPLEKTQSLSGGSGYSSERQTGRYELIEESELLFEWEDRTGLARDYSNDSYADNMRTINWGFSTQEGTSNHSEPDIEQTTHIPTLAPYQDQVDPDIQNTWWHANMLGTANMNLESPATPVEAQCQSRGWCPLRNDFNVANENRRQTISAPASSESTNVFNEAFLRAPNAYDDMFLPLSKQTPNIDSTASELSNWFNVNPNYLSPWSATHPSEMDVQSENLVNTRITEPMDIGRSQSLPHNTYFTRWPPPPRCQGLPTVDQNLSQYHPSDDGEVAVANDAFSRLDPQFQG